eukprot:m.340599 g.340599  ORF g.340599 m.340599 type:complete len:516 (-) comp19406_c0_seq1:139-1686(-)
MRSFIVFLTILSFAFMAEAGKKKSKPTFTVVGNISQPLLAQAFAAQSIPAPAYGIKILRVTYPALYKSGGKKKKAKKSNLNGLLIMPMGNMAPVLPASIWFHGTSGNSYRVSSNAFAESFPCESVVDLGAGRCLPDFAEGATVSAMIAAGAGVVSMAPDGIGYGGEFATETYPYLIAEAYGIAGFSMLEAVEDWLDDKYDQELTQHVVAGGYSEGGYAAVAMQKLSTTEYFKNTEHDIVMSIAGAGPYDLTGEQMCYVTEEQATYPVPGYYPFFIKGYSDYYDLDAINPIYEDFVDTVLAGNVSNFAISVQTATITLGNPLHTINAQSIQDSKDICDGNAELKDFDEDTLIGRMYENSVMVGWEPADNSVYLCHYDADTVVLSANTKAFKSKFPNATNAVILPEGTCGGHSDCYLTCIGAGLQALEGYLNALAVGAFDEPMMSGKKGGKSKGKKSKLLQFSKESLQAFSPMLAAGVVSVFAIVGLIIKKRVSTHEGDALLQSKGYTTPTEYEALP